MAEGKFTRREVDRSFRKFRDTYSDLTSARSQTWADNLRRLLEHCETDPVMRVVTEPLRNNPNVDVDRWHADFLAGVGSRPGSGHYTLPTSDEDRTALLYQFLRKLDDDSIDLNKFCLAAYGSMPIQEQLDTVTSELVSKFAREVMYRLAEVEADLGGDAEVSREKLQQVFHHYHGDYFEGIQGSVIATGSSTIDRSPAHYESKAEAIAGLRGLKDHIDGVAEGQRRATEDSIDLLIRAIETETVPRREVFHAAETVNEGSPVMKGALAAIVEKLTETAFRAEIAAAISRLGSPGSGADGPL